MATLSQPTLFDFFDSRTFPMSAEVLHAVEMLASNSSIAARGAVFTRIEVVDFILDLIGYTENYPLYKQRILEPSFGAGDFLLPVIDRLLSSWRKNSGDPEAVVNELADAICSVELHRETFVATRQAVIKQLVNNEITAKSASALADCWLTQGDFLLEPLTNQFDYVIGNPPYVRQELIPGPLLAEYRRRYSTIYDRADLYIPFIEHSLLLLKKGGVLGYICADRWMKNRYGGPLRKLISQDFHLKAYVDMVDTDAFRAAVSAYPAITIISREKPGVTRIAHRPEIESGTLSSLAAEIRSNTLSKETSVRELACIANGAEPWLLESSDQIALMRRLEKEYPSLEQAGCKVSIGVATGADKAFIGNFDSLDVEPDRKLPLVTTRDIQSGEVVWSGQGVINPFTDNGELVDLATYPKLASYLEARKKVISRRHCAQRIPEKWYRTIDRIWPALAKEPKLLIPDIKGEAHVVFDHGELYPHHNLYYITSQTWDLRALQAVLLSSIAKLFVETYSTKMRGGYLRFQAQYLRRIRIPIWPGVATGLRGELIEAATRRDVDACNKAVFKLYKLNKNERSILAETGENNGT